MSLWKCQNCDALERSHIRPPPACLFCGSKKFFPVELGPPPIGIPEPAELSAYRRAFACRPIPRSKWASPQMPIPRHGKTRSDGPFLTTTGCADGGVTPLPASEAPAVRLKARPRRAKRS
jgi:hypothetical protein